jgi:hypothetical protein
MIKATGASSGAISKKDPRCAVEENTEPYVKEGGT